jgi:hypothetical protein
VRAVRLASLALLLLAGCASESASSNSATIERTKISYDSTRPQLGSRKTELEVKDEDGKCTHSWVAGRPHRYDDLSSGIPMADLCTPVYCTKCGLERHECEQRGRGR